MEMRLTALEQQVQKILSMLQSSAVSQEPMKADEQKKEEAKDVTLPKTESEKVQGQDPASGAKDDKLNFVDKADFEKVVKEVSDIKKSLEVGKSTTPRMNENDKSIKKEDNTIPLPKSFKEAHEMIRKLKK
jgi:hypothetical protein